MAIRAPGPRSTQPGSYTELDDRLLVLDFQAGHVEAFVEIHHRYAGLARHVCGRFLKNQQDVDEALQETWIRVFQGLHRFNGRFQLPAWISRIATNVSLDVLRARARRPKLDDQPIDAHEREDVADGPEEEVEKLIQRDVVIGVLATLPDTHRQALVLRELEGRSHKEIAAELEITTAQAKALIHRAKGTFRREWLRAATERHGLAGIFLLPVIWLSKLGGIARKVADRTAEVVQVGGSDVVTHAAQAASAPVVPVAASAATTFSQVGERIVAAGLTLLVAGGVTVGAATIARDRSDRDKPEAVVAAPVHTPSEDPSPAEPVVVEEEAEKKVKDLRADEAAKREKEPEVVAPIEEPSASPTADPSPSPSGEPSPDASPSAQPTPTIPPAPVWTLSFQSSVPVKAEMFEEVSSRVTGRAGGDLVFSQVAWAPVVDRDGHVVGRVYVEYWGSIEDEAGTGGFLMLLDTEQGRYRYDGSAGLVAHAAGDEGTFAYSFSGPYSLTDGPATEEPEVVPHDGTFSLTLRFWADRTSLYGAEISLAESSLPA